MKILCIIPPYLPSYFNAGHHLPVFQVGNYIRKNLPGSEVTCIDAAALNTTWKEICNELVKPYQIIMLLNDFDAIDTFERFMKYKEIFVPSAKVITFGRLSKQIPRFFFQFKVDAVHCLGDYEPNLLAYVKYVQGESKELPGIITSKESTPTPALPFPAEEWVMADVNEIPYANYNNMYKNDLNKFCGIPQRQELVVPAVKGCPVGCSFCDVPFMQGKSERRMPVDDVINYIEDSFKKQPFEYLTFYAPTFTLDHKWVNEFCEKMVAKQRRYPWKCVTVLKRLNKGLVEQMAKAGCVRISLGIESFTHEAALGLPKVKRDILSEFVEIANICKENSIEVNCFVILGLPGDTPENVKHTLQTCLSMGLRVRPTIFTPYQNLREDMSVHEVNQYNRQFFPDGLYEPEVAREYYQLFYNLTGDRSTSVMEHIPQVEECLSV